MNAFDGFLPEPESSSSCKWPQAMKVEVQITSSLCRTPPVTVGPAACGQMELQNADGEAMERHDQDQKDSS